MAKRPVGEKLGGTLGLGGKTTRGRNVQGAKHPVKGRNVHKPIHITTPGSVVIIIIIIITVNLYRAFL